MIAGDDERLTLVRQRLANGERVDAARFAVGIANRARNDEERREDAETLADLVRVLADALISIGDKHDGAGRPKKRGNLRTLFESIAPEEYARLIVAGDVVEGRAVAPQDGAKFLWWAVIGETWCERNEAGSADMSPDDVISFLTDSLGSDTHQHHAHYVSMLQDAAHRVLEAEGLGTVERQKFRAEARKKIIEKWHFLGATDAVFERIQTAKRARARKVPR